MNSIEIEIPATARNLNRTVSLWLRRDEMTYRAGLTGHEQVGQAVIFRETSEPAPDETSCKVIAMTAPVTGSVWVTVEISHGELSA